VVFEPGKIAEGFISFLYNICVKHAAKMEGCARKRELKYESVGTGHGTRYLAP
jgi:hypothetical protein